MNFLLSDDYVSSFYKKYDTRKMDECKYISDSITNLFNNTIKSENVDLGKKNIQILDDKKLDVLRFKPFDSCKEYDDLRKSFKKLGIEFKFHNMYSLSKSTIEYNVINKQIDVYQKIHLIE